MTGRCRRIAQCVDQTDELTVSVRVDGDKRLAGDIEPACAGMPVAVHFMIQAKRCVVRDRQDACAALTLRDPAIGQHNCCAGRCDLG